MRSLILLLIILVTNAMAQSPLINYSANLPATDAIGRKLPMTGVIRKNRYVGIFYWPWHYYYQAKNQPPINLSKLVKDKPELKFNDNYNDVLWPKEGVYFWNEPLFGFYTSTDKWVLWKHAEMLADANIDVIFFDCTNGSLVWKPAYTALCEVFIEARKNGIKTPEIAFMTAFGPVDGGQNAINQLYKELYEPGLYKELWFHWKGKPLLLSYPDFMKDIPGNPAGSQFHKDVRNFFTFRPVQPDYAKLPERQNQWGWLQIYPQHGFVKKKGGGFEEMPVSVSQNWSKTRGLTAMNSPDVFGRSYTKAKGQDKRNNAFLYGLNFQEQWNFALKQDVEFIFITGWNEWIVERQREWGQQRNAFPDEYNTENSRDIEPMKGGFGDNYYYQMVANIRRFKGVPVEEKASVTKKIIIDANFEEWSKVRPEFKAHRGSTLHRDSPGFLPHHYKNNSGRNDIIGARVARDEKYVYFYVETADKLTPFTDKNWMTLFIDLDRSKSTGWQGYDIVLNRRRTSNSATLEKHTKGFDWTTIASVQYASKGNKLEMKIPRKLLQNTGKSLNFEFKWSDNCQEEGDIMDFWLNGDVAPAGRYNYHYKAN
ncbi:glycoside hydrolase family 71/99 protein [Spirosoma lituiforme]